MINDWQTNLKFKLVVDNFAETNGLLRHCIDEEFWDFSTVVPEKGAVYIIGRQQLLENRQKIIDMSSSGDYIVVFDNSAEGSYTLDNHIKYYKLDQLILHKKLLLIGGADIGPEYPCLSHDHFLSTILNYKENLQAQERTSEIFSKIHKPYKFLFLNGRARPHRKYLYERFKRNGILDLSLWTMLDSSPCIVKSFDFEENGINVMSMPSSVQRLPDFYEVSRYKSPGFSLQDPGHGFIKKQLFREEWGEIYIEPAPYIDTYFSLVTETVYAESNYSFRTEKIAKPLAMGHPFIVTSNKGFYKDLHELGFKTFGHLIDESFDQIENAQQRLDRIVDIVTDLCQQDLDSFIVECREVCTHNQQHLQDLAIQNRKDFPNRFFHFLKTYTSC